MHRLRLAGAASSGVLALCCLPAVAGAQTRSSTTRAVDQAVSALGGEDAVSGLRSFRFQATGRAFIFDEGLQPNDEPSPASTFTSTVTWERGSGSGSAGARLRADSVRTSLGNERKITEVVAGRLGYLSGVDGNGAPSATTAMTSDRMAAVTREQRLLNPQLILRDVLARPQLASTAPGRRLNGRQHRVLVVRDAAAPIRLYVDSRTGRIDRLTTDDHSPMRRDVRIVVDYTGWRRATSATGGSRARVSFPRTVTLKVDGATLHTETRSAVSVNRAANGALFRFPDGVDATFDSALATRGSRSTEWLMSFAQFGFPKDGPETQISPRGVAPGSTLIQGVANNTMIVEQQNGIVVVEGALGEARAEALISYIRETYPGKPIRFVTGSHHHADHAGGMRPFVALGATAVVHQNAVPLFRRQFADRSSRLLPDRLDGTTRAAQIQPVPSTGRITLNDPARPVIVLPETTTHASTTILVFVPDQGVLFVNGDTYTPGGPVGPGAQSLEQTIRANSLNVQWIVGGHGTVVPYAAFRQALGQPLT